MVNDSDFDYEINTEGDNTEGGGDLHDGLGGSTEDEDEGELEESGMGAAVRGGGRPKKGGTVAAASSSSTRCV